MPLPDEGDDSAEATRLRTLVLAAADSTIGQTIALRSNMLAMAQDTRADEHDRPRGQGKPVAGPVVVESG